MFCNESIDLGGCRNSNPGTVSEVVCAVVNGEDQIFLEKLGGPVGQGSEWKLLIRRGRVLLVMPATREGIKAGTGMYSPQRKVARLVNWCLVNVPGVWRLLPSVRWKVDSGSPLGRIVEDSNCQPGAILFGNPDQAGRRSLMVSEGLDPMVVKIGVGEIAAKLVRSEGEFIEAESNVVDQ